MEDISQMRLINKFVGTLFSQTSDFFLAGIYFCVFSQIPLLEFTFGDDEF